MRYTHRNIDFLLDGSEYYDFELAADNTPVYGDFVSDDDLAIYIDVCSGMTSLVRWTGSTSEEFEQPYITTTGLDNFFINMPNAYVNGIINTGITTEFTINEYFQFFPVSGWTTELNYAIDTSTQCLAKLNGGFYQGFFKLYGYPYELLPTRMRKGWTVDMIVKYPATHIGTGTTLNDIFPNNSGFIFYIGSRSEDKYWNGFTTGTPSETSVLFNWTGLTITDERYQTYVYPSLNAGLGGVDINWYRPSESPTRDYLYYHTSNQGYGLYPTTNDGNVYGGFKIGYAYGGGGVESMQTGSTAQMTYSPLFTYGDDFLTTGGTSYTGYYHYTNHQPYESRYYDDDTKPLYVKYPWKSITDNAFGIRIAPDGRIGYRVLRIGNICQTGTTVTIENGVTGTTTMNYKIEEAYSPNQIWNAGNTGYTNITIVFERYIEITGCNLLTNDYRNGTLTIYVNGRPVLKQDNFEEIIPHELDRQKELQSGVPFNISWGGGTQGLYESVTYGGIDQADRNLLLQTLFAGSWMGSLQSFKMYIRPMHVAEIIHNFQMRQDIYDMDGDFGGRYIFITKG
jgi:hypothetical protein